MNSSPFGIAISDGLVYFTESYGNKIGRLTLAYIELFGYPLTFIEFLSVISLFVALAAIVTVFLILAKMRRRRRLPPPPPPSLFWRIQLSC